MNLGQSGADEKIMEVLKVTSAYGVAIHVNAGEYIQYVDVKSGREIPEDVMREQVMIYMLIMSQDPRSCAIRRLMVLLYEDIMGEDSLDFESLTDETKQFLTHMKNINGMIRKFKAEMESGTGTWEPEPVKSEHQWKFAEEINKMLEDLKKRNREEGGGDSDDEG